jgi:predicted anti-sigma-YlaC factor YlaD
MDCTYGRELLSARLDGERLSTSEDDALEAHLAGCPTCRAFAADAALLHRSGRVRPAEPVPDLASAILATAPDLGAARWRTLTGAQIALGVVGLVLLVIALPTMVLHTGGGGVVHHTTRELAAFQGALGLGFLVVAWDPRRATGVLPMVATLVGALCTIALVDVVRGHVPSLAEAQHAFELAGLVLVWWVARADGGRVMARRSLGVA